MQVEVRDVVVTLVDASFKLAFPDIEMVYDNSPFDWNNPPTRFVLFEVEFYDGHQVGMSQQPKTRYSGWAYVTVYAKEGTGSRDMLTMLDWFKVRLGYVYEAPVQFKTPVPMGSRDVRGWYTQQLKVPFYTDPA